MTLYALPPSNPLIPSLATFIRSSGTALADWHILLPNRRACRALRDELMRQQGGTAMLLPLIQPVGEEDSALSLIAHPDAAPIPPAAHPMERALVLARIIKAAHADWSMARCLALGSDLGQLIDRAIREAVPFEALMDLVDADYADHWQVTLSFLKEVMVSIWPDYLKTNHRVDTATQKQAMIKSLTKRIAVTGLDKPTLLAGIALNTDDMVALARAITHDDHGLVVLDGLMPNMDVDDLDHLDETHPSWSQWRFLQDMDKTPSDIPLLPTAATDTRDRLVTSWMRPAETTLRWRESPIPDGALNDISLCVCQDREEEALTIAIALREVLEKPGKTAALVTPDRMLAARVCAMMRRWGVTLDDSGGEPLHATPLGAWALSILDSILAGDDPSHALPVFKSSFAAGGTDWPIDTPLRDRVREWEVWTRLSERARKGPEPETMTRLMPLLDPLKTGHQDIQSWLTAHVTVMQAVAALPGQGVETGASRLWVGPTGEALASLMRDLLSHQHLLAGLDLVGYRAVLAYFMAQQSVRPPFGTHPRLSVLGLIESRSIHPDRVILGGLNEGVWPALPPHDPWMSEAMRQKAGFLPAAQMIGQAAHDFMMRLSASEIIMTRAARVEGKPSLPSRFLSRLDTWLRADGKSLDILLKEGDQWLALAREYEKRHPDTQPIIRAQRPVGQARPEDFPKTLPVTKVELLSRDPYSFYAQRILGLYPLPPLAAPAGAMEKGIAWHSVMEHWLRVYPDGALPETAHETLHQLAQDILGAPDQPLIARTVWLSRFIALIPALVEQERDWRTRNSVQSFVEREGEAHLIGQTNLSAKADRIDRLREGGWAVIDYKTGTIPSTKDMAEGRKVQLTLEASILNAGGFKGIQGTARSLVYRRLAKDMNTSILDQDVETTAQFVLDRLRGLVASYLEAGRSYPSCPYGFKQDFLPPAAREYDHLARVLEWSGVEEDAA